MPGIRKDILCELFKDNGVADNVAYAIMMSLPAIQTSYSNFETLYFNIIHPETGRVAAILHKQFGFPIEVHDVIDLPYIKIKAHQLRTILDTAYQMYPDIQKNMAQAMVGQQESWKDTEETMIACMRAIGYKVYLQMFGIEQ